jgi:hypothetical protein
MTTYLTGQLYVRNRFNIRLVVGNLIRAKAKRSLRLRGGKNVYYKKR